MVTPDVEPFQVTTDEVKKFDPVTVIERLLDCPAWVLVGVIEFTAGGITARDTAFDDTPLKLSAIVTIAVPAVAIRLAGIATVAAVPELPAFTVNWEVFPPSVKLI